MKIKASFAALFIALASIHSAQAAPKLVPLQVGSILTTPVGIENFYQSGKSSIFYSNTNGKSSDISLFANDLTGTTIWQRTIDSGADEIASAMTGDSQGNIWLAGSAALPLTLETPTSTVGIDNPDGVTSENGLTLRNDMTQLALWKISPTGELLATYLSAQISIPVVASISINTSGISIVGDLEGKPFFATASLQGVFGKQINIGTSKTILNSVVRQSDGSSSIFGSSTETLGGKKVAGKRDGVLIKVSKSPAVTNVVRSSANGASRGWTSADASLALAGYVVAGRKVEVAITKFTTAFAPTWTARFAGSGDAIVTSGGGNTYLAFTSTAPVQGVSGWKPTAPSLLILTFDAKGQIKAAQSFPGLLRPLHLQVSRDRGVVGLASAANGSVSIFTLISR